MIQITRLEAEHIASTLGEVREYLDYNDPDHEGLIDQVDTSIEILTACLTKPEIPILDGTACIEDEFSLI